MYIYIYIYILRAKAVLHITWRIGHSVVTFSCPSLPYPIIGFVHLHAAL